MNQCLMESERSKKFDPHAFRKALLRYLLLFSSPLILFGVVSVFLPVEGVSGWAHGPWWDGVALGPIAVGGVAVGIVALGGWSVGIIAVGGCSVGLVAIGGGAVGLIACGGGALGYIALGGGGVGRYVLAGGGKGTFVLSYSRQDGQAVQFFCRYLKRLRNAFPNGVED